MASNAPRAAQLIRMISVIRLRWPYRVSMNCNPTVLLLVFGRHLMWFRSDGNGGTTTFYYDDEITWLLAAVALFLLTWFLLSRYLRARRLRRPSQIGRAHV